jgi:hypothetical protein
MISENIKLKYRYLYHTQEGSVKESKGREEENEIKIQLRIFGKEWVLIDAKIQIFEKSWQKIINYCGEREKKKEEEILKRAKKGSGR